MGLLRAFADAVVVGVGTVRAEGGRALWTPNFIFPAAAEEYRALRQSLKRAAEPMLVIVTSRGDLDASERALQKGAIVLTTKTGASRLRKTLPSATEVHAIADGDRLDGKSILEAVKAEGHRTILTEGGSQLFGEMVAKDLVDELFLTVSPSLVGHDSDESFGILRGVSFNRHPKWSQLLSVRRHESHLFLRYRLKDSSRSLSDAESPNPPSPSGGGSGRG